MAPNSEDRSIVMIKQGVIAIAAFDTFNRTIDSIAKLQYFSDCKSSPCREIAKEQQQTDYNFIYWTKMIVTPTTKTQNER